jgi:cell wall-associated NlpC family hydrolase
VKPEPPKAPEQTPPSTSPSGALPSYYEKALKYPGVMYTVGGFKPSGYDCSGLICLVTGQKDHSWSTSAPGAPPGGWTKINTSTDSYEKFISNVKVGDLFLWRKSHTGFYAGNNQVYGAKSSGKPSGFTKNVKGYNELKQYWLPKLGYPEVWRQK